MNTLSKMKLYAGLSTALLAFAIASGSSAVAQDGRVKVDIPFGFENGAQHLPAGRYSIGMDTQRIMRIQGDGHGGSTLVQPEQALEPAAVSKVVFRKYGNRYFLRDVYVQGRSSHQVCIRSKAEKQLQVAKNNPEPNGVEVALLESPR